MVKGFILFKEGRIPFVIKEYRMELFTDDDLLKEFCKEYNFKENYTLQGLCFTDGLNGQSATFLVEYSMGNTCYLRCYIFDMLASKSTYNTIGFESYFLDDIFRYKYEYIDMVRAGTNLAIEPKDVHRIPFSINKLNYELVYRIGHDNRLGLLEDFDRKGECLVKLNTCNIEECYNIAVILHRLAMFMTSHAKTPFKCITLYNNGIKTGWFFFPFIDDTAFSGHEVDFCEFDVTKYIPSILNNISLDSGNKITKSIPLGHLGDVNSQFSPQRFIEQIMAFEYLFEKLEQKKAQDNSFPLKQELEYMFKKFPEIISENSSLSVEQVCYNIKELRRHITHGYAYYYDFKNDSDAQYLIILLDKLIKKMSLLLVGFTDKDINEYPLIF